MPSTAGGFEAEMDEKARSGLGTDSHLSQILFDSECDRDAELLPVPRTPSLSVIIEPEVSGSAKEVQPRVLA
jgi:hypothetical protein